MMIIILQRTDSDKVLGCPKRALLPRLTSAAKRSTRPTNFIVLVSFSFFLFTSSNSATTNELCKSFGGTNDWLKDGMLYSPSHKREKEASLFRYCRGSWFLVQQKSTMSTFRVNLAGIYNWAKYYGLLQIKWQLCTSYSYGAVSSL